MKKSSLHFALVQMDIVWENKQANLAYIETQLKNLEAGRVVVLPEMFSTGFSMRVEALAETMDGPTVQKLKTWAAKYGLILTGSIIVRENERCFNRMLWVQPDGRIYHYDKRHLFALAEENAHFTPGHDRVIAQIGGWKILLQICFDLRFPVWQRNVDDYDAMVLVACWPESRIQAWEKLLLARAIENQCYVLAVNRIGLDPSSNYSGHSMVVDPLGKIIHHADSEPHIMRVELQAKKLDSIREKFPFLGFRDSFNLER